MGRKKYVVIVAGGSGSRMGGTIPKQFIEIDGKPILRHTIEQFLSLSFDVEVILVLSDEMKGYWKEYCRISDFLPHYYLPSGGITRFHSVKNGLEYVPDGAIVAIHDGVRPFVSKAFLESCFLQAEVYPAIIPAIIPVDTVREKTDRSSYQIDREKLVLVQTPQIFHSEVIKEAYKQPYKSHFTDDASVVESYGVELKLIEGLRYNIKITTPDDLLLAEAMLTKK